VLDTPFEPEAGAYAEHHHHGHDHDHAHPTAESAPASTESG
jgi:hypothetical protein